MINLKWSLDTLTSTLTKNPLYLIWHGTCKNIVHAQSNILSLNSSEIRSTPRQLQKLIPMQTNTCMYTDANMLNRHIKMSLVCVSCAVRYFSLPSANEVCGKAIFLLMSVILSTLSRGLCPGELSVRGSLSRVSLSRGSLSWWVGSTTQDRDLATVKSGRCTSYWNAFLFVYMFKGNTANTRGVFN